MVHGDGLTRLDERVCSVIGLLKRDGHLDTGEVDYLAVLGDGERPGGELVVQDGAVPQDLGSLGAVVGDRGGEFEVIERADARRSSEGHNEVVRPLEGGRKSDTEKAEGDERAEEHLETE